ncbi:NB-ARC domain-containing protein [Flammeovirgaceae bacterium SG7u.111]|nr:NB-ARC domain-containing protein [Flammeovirgaceae bacterium SG7u.132]WPO37129.1 NB-ARC domain-containing protein [Flammeovirgaceae bacterium SG7u.111]
MDSSKIHVLYFSKHEDNQSPESERIFDLLDRAFQKEGYNIKQDLKDSEPLRDFIIRVGSSDALIIIIEKKYLESQKYMFGLAKAYDWGHDFDKRIFPIVLKDAKEIIYSENGRLELISYWEKKFGSLDKKLAPLSFSQKAAFEEKYSDLSFIKEKVHIPLAKISGKVWTDPQILIEDDFKELIKQVEKQIRKEAKPLTTIPKVDENKLKEFVDRVPKLEKLHKTLQIHSDTNCIRFLLHGLGGFGKTMLAKKYIDLHKASYDTISWIDYEDDTIEIIKQFTKFSKPPSTLNEEKFRDEFFEYLEEQEGFNLIVLDNITPKVSITLEQFISRIESLKKGKFRLIVTSRKLDERYWAFKNTLEVDKLEKKYAFRLFKEHAPSLRKGHSLRLKFQKDKTEIESIINKVYSNTKLIIIAAGLANRVGPRYINRKLDERGLFGMNENIVAFEGKEEYVRNVLNELYQLDSTIIGIKRELLFTSALFSVKNFSFQDIQFLYGEQSHHNNNKIANAIHSLAEDGWIENYGGRYTIHDLIGGLLRDNIAIAPEKEGFKISDFNPQLQRMYVALLSKPEDIYDREIFLDLAQAFLELNIFEHIYEVMQLKIVVALASIHLSGRYQEKLIKYYLDEVIEYCKDNLEENENYKLYIEANEVFSFFYQLLGESTKSEYDIALRYEEEAVKAKSRFGTNLFQQSLEHYNFGLIFKAKRKGENSEKAIQFFEKSIESFRRLQQIKDISVSQKSYSISNGRKINLIEVEGMTSPMGVEEYIINAYDSIGDTRRLRANENIKALNSKDKSQDIEKQIEEDLQLALEAINESLALGEKYYVKEDKKYLLRNYTSLGHVYKSLYEYYGNDNYKGESSTYHEKALSLCEKIKEERDETYDNDFITKNVARAYQSAAEFYEYIENNEKALLFYDETLKIREKMLPSEHHKLKNTRKSKKRVEDKINTK